MKDVIVVYSSNYGHTEKYAKYIAEKLNCKIVKLSETNVKEVSEYDAIIYCAPMKNSLVQHLYKFTCNYDLFKPDTKFYVFADGALPPSKELLKRIVTDNFCKEDADKVKFFYGEGGIDLDSLKWTDILQFRWYWEEGQRRGPGERMYEISNMLFESFDHTNMAYADVLIQKVKEELDE